MPLPDPSGWYPAEAAARAQLSAQPPQYVLDQIGGSYDQSRYYWNPDTFSLVDRYTGGSYSYDRADPANGTDVITNYGNAAQDTIHYGAGQTPYFGFGDSAQGYNGGDAPNSGMFISADPNAIGDYQSHRQDVVNRGVASVGALVGGAALGGALSGGNGVTAATQNYTAPTAVGGASATAAPGTFGQAAFLPAASGSGGAAAAGGAGAVGNFLSKYSDYIVPAVTGLAGVYAADRASDAEVGALDRALAQNQAQFDQTRTDALPWITAGTNALARLQDPSGFTTSPGYEFRRSEGQRDIGNSFAARGAGQSGNALRALTEYNQNLASDEYNNFFGQQLNLAGMGSDTARAVGTIGANASNVAGSYLAGQGASRASGVLGKYGALANAGSDIYQNYLYRRRA